MNTVVKLIISFLLIFILSGYFINAGMGTGEGGTFQHMKFGLKMAEKNLFHAGMLLKIKDKIGLSQSQVKKIEKMKASHEELWIKKEADIKILKLKLDNYLKNEKLERGRIEKMIRGIAKVKTGMQIEQIHYLLDLRELLTSEQLTKIEELKKKMRHKRMHRHKTRNKRR
jgi:hypothetical protein